MGYVPLPRPTDLDERAAHRALLVRMLGYDPALVDRSSRWSRLRYIAWSLFGRR